MKTIEYYYDFASPNAYLVHKLLPGIAAAHGAGLVYRPALLGGIFKATNNTPPMVAFAGVSNKVDYMRIEIARFQERYGLELRWNTHFPVNTVMAMRAAVHAIGQDWESAFIDAMFEATWTHGLNIGDAALVHGVLAEHGLPADDIAAAVQDQAIKDKLRDLTDAAVARKVFGMPTMFVGTEMFFGKDSLNWLEWELQK